MPSFPCNIITLSVNDLDAVDGLMKRNSKTLGFLTGETLRQFLSRETVFGAVSQSVVVGYLCFASYANRYRIVHLCVSEDHRGLGIARKLVDRLVNNATTQCLVELNCRRDFPANELWPMLDFIPVAEKPAKSGKGRTLTKWQRRLGDPSQLDLFREKLSDKAASVVMDAQIVYHLSAELSTETAPSQALLSDFLVDEIELCVTDEIFKEIDRKDDPLVRQRSRRTAQTYRTIVHDPGRASFYASILRQMLPDTSPADHSDIEHLAKAAASPENTFVTRDARLLANAGDIEAKIGVRVVSPEVLIGQFHALADPRAHRPSFVSGVQFSWHPIAAGSLKATAEVLRRDEERARALTHWLLQYVSHPETFRCETLESPAGRVGMRVWETHADGVVFHFIRRARLGASLAAQVEEFLAADTLALAVTQEVDVVSIIAAGLDPRVAPHLERMCFKHVGDSFVRPCMQRAVSVDEGNGLVNRSVPHIGTLYHKRAARCAQSALVAGILGRLRTSERPSANQASVCLESPGPTCCFGGSFRRQGARPDEMGECLLPQVLSSKPARAASEDLLVCQRPQRRYRGDLAVGPDRGRRRKGVVPAPFARRNAGMAGHLQTLRRRPNAEDHGAGVLPHVCVQKANLA